jgi:acyl-CoA synthetase (AMP-forming)/AMP-acid ligase II
VSGRAAAPGGADLIEVLARRARDQPDALAYATDADRATYGGLAEDVGRLAAGLRDSGLASGHRVALLLPTGLDFVRTFLAVQSAGAVPVAVDGEGTPPSRALRLAAVRPHLVVFDAAVLSPPAGPEAGAPWIELGSLRRGGSPETSLGDPEAGPRLSHLQLTSGSTGRPRAAMITHANVMAYLSASLTQLGVLARDVLVGWVPLHHPMGLVRFVLGPLYYGCPAHLVPPSVLTLERWLRAIARERGTLTAGPDFAWRAATRLVDPSGLDLRCLRVATSGGEPVRLSTLRAFEERFALPGVLRPGYGLAEATLAVTGLRPGEPLRVDASGLVSCGTPLPDLELRISDGEILVRGRTVFAGYLDDPAGTRAVLDGGWLRTGDMGYVDGQGHLFVKSRLRALIKRGGATIAPHEVEEPVDVLPGVRRSAALGVPGPGGGETLVLVVEADPKAPEDPRSLAQAALRAVAAATGLAPDEVLVLSPDTLPLAPSGKVMYGELRSQLEAAPGDRPWRPLWPRG